MKKSYAQALTEERRLVILRLLSELPAYCANSSTLRTLLEQWGFTPSRDQVKTDLRWLQEQQLVDVDDIAEGDVLVTTLTERGQDVALGRAIVDGIKRPGA